MAGTDSRLQNFHNSCKNKILDKLEIYDLLVVIYDLILLSILISEHRSLHRPICCHLVLSIVLIYTRNSPILLVRLITESNNPCRLELLSTQTDGVV